MNKHNSNKLKENSNTVRHVIMGQIITTQNLVAIKEVRHAGQKLIALTRTLVLSVAVGGLAQICVKVSARTVITLLWRHNGGEFILNHQPDDYLLNRLFGHWSKKTSRLRVAGLCVSNWPETGEFPAQMASNTENVSIWWCHHEVHILDQCLMV